MVLRHDERVVTGLLYLWIRDGNLPLTLETVEYIKSHYLAFLGNDELRFSSEEIVDFIEGAHFVQPIVRRLRGLRPGRRRQQRDQVYGHKRLKVQVTALDNSE